MNSSVRMPLRLRCSCQPAQAVSNSADWRGLVAATVTASLSGEGDEGIYARRLLDDAKPCFRRRQTRKLQQLGVLPVDQCPVQMKLHEPAAGVARNHVADEQRTPRRDRAVERTAQLGPGVALQVVAQPASIDHVVLA